MSDGPLTSLDDLLALLGQAHGLHDLGDGGVSITDHGLQCAHQLAQERPDDVELQVAGLVHDVGWLERSPDGWCVDPAAAHDARGAEMVGPLLGERVAALVGGHVDAKRYLVATDAGYRSRLSPASVATLSFQGEAMDAAEVAEFEARADCADLVALRTADDAAKVVGVDVGDLDRWRPALADLAQTSFL